ncbi:MAG: FTR1 family iron permease [Actinomycetes bacterium]
MATALLIMIREGFEAALVVAIVYAYLRRIQRMDLARAVWVGVGAATAVAFGAGIAIHLTIGNLEGVDRLRAFAAVSLFAVCVLTWMIFWMRRQARKIKGALEHSIDAAIDAGGNVKAAITLVAFFAVAREGLEAALFLIAAATEEDGTEVLIGGIVGLAIASVMGYLVVLGGRRLPMQAFFKVTGLVLIVFAAGLFARTVAYLQFSGDLGITYDAVYDLTGFASLTVDTETGRFLTAMLGWDPRPSIEQVLAYVLYLGVTAYLFLRTPRGAQPAPQQQATPTPAQR